jgi:catechol 2,3-dioxygenase-like lactoylglutathione lyase family enzyme
MRHFCFRLVDEAAVDRAAGELRSAGVETTEPRYYPEYGPDYYVIFFEDPGGVRLEVMIFGRCGGSSCTTGRPGPACSLSPR